MDDLLITSASPSFIRRIVTVLSKKFTIKDLGNLSYFLGVEVILCSFGLIFSQHKYIRDLLQWFNMEEAKGSVIPLSFTTKLTIGNGDTLADTGSYRSLISSMQYLSLM